MMPLTGQTICAAVGGTVLQSSGAAVRDVTTDSRRVPQEALFIPLVGERFDGHAYIGKALEAGAAGCLTAKTPEALLPGKFYIQVPDTRLALKALAAWYRGQFRLPVVQVTGSVGKTTTKEMIAAVLTQKYETLRTEGNLNNDIGAPLTLLRLTAEHEAAVIETGMNHAGELTDLSSLTRPDAAIVTMVGAAAGMTILVAVCRGDNSSVLATLRHSRRTDATPKAVLVSIGQIEQIKITKMLDALESLMV